MPLGTHAYEPLTLGWRSALGRKGEAVAQAAKPAQARSETRGWLFTAEDLPRLMSVPPSVDTGPYRAPLLQFIWDWNVASDMADLISEAPVYDGDDPLLLPTLAVVVHALADRDGVPVPGWVLGHRAPEDVMMFGWPFDGRYAQWIRRRSLAVCAYHRVWFHPRTLDKGTPDWWLPWD